jgi:DNA replication protein DnaC
MNNVTASPRGITSKIVDVGGALANTFCPKPQVCPDCGCNHEDITALCDPCTTLRLEAIRAEERREDLGRKKEAWFDICPPAYRKTDWSRRELSPVLAKIATAWQMTAGKPFLILYGKTGRGKTRAGFAVLRRMLIAGYSVHAVHAGDAWDKGYHVQGLSSAARLRHDDDRRMADEADSCIDKAKSAQYLLIDDLGKERTGRDGKVSEAVAETLFGVIERRLSFRQPTIITTNLSWGDVMKRFATDRGYPLIRRIDEETAEFPTIS